MENEISTSNENSSDSNKDKNIWSRWKLPLIGEIRFNPVVSFVSLAIICTFVAWCCIEQDRVPFGLWRAWIVEKFCWLYILTQACCPLLMIWLFFSQYSSLKLGKEDDRPDFSDATWFMMLFSCGIGVGLFFYGVSEPIFHYTGRNRYTADPTMPDNTAAQHAMNITFFHWGFHGWILYSLIGLLLGLVSYREGLQLTMKSCLYPLIGDRIYGWIGDLVDIVSVITTLFGVCTSLGLGARQLNTGFNVLNNNIAPDDVWIQTIIIWCITAIATMSTVSGLDIGIKVISVVCFSIGMFLMLATFFLDEPFYILNLFVQSLGFYAQHVIQLGWHTDAFEQLSKSARTAYQRFVPEGFEDPDGPEDWIDGWTMFYWGWWISWSPFVGMFIAKISKGRTIREYIVGTLSGPVFYTFMWLAIFGGAGLRQERLASAIGLCCKDNLNWFYNVSRLNDTIFSREAQDQPVEASSAYWSCEGGTCGPCASSVLTLKESENLTYGGMLQEIIDLGEDFGSTLASRRLTKLSCHSTEQMWFDVMRSFGDVGPFMAVFSLFGIVFYFITSSDSGSLVIDCLTSNGDADPPKIQRVFWSITEGATATALLTASGKKGLVALQTAGIVSGLPFSMLVFPLCLAVWKSVSKGSVPERKFPVDLFRPLWADPYKDIYKNPQEPRELFLKFLSNIFIAPWTIANAIHKLNFERKGLWFYLFITVPFYILTIILFLSEAGTRGCWAFALICYLFYAAVIAAIRMEVRLAFNIPGNILADYFASLFLYPSVAIQLDAITQGGETNEKSGNLAGKQNLGAIVGDSSSNSDDIP